MRLVVTAAFIVIGLMVSKTAMACAPGACLATDHKRKFANPPAFHCSQLEKNVGVPRVTCGIYAPQELVTIKLAAEAK